jgi:hypothetical protein
MQSARPHGPTARGCSAGARNGGGKENGRRFQENTGDLNFHLKEAGQAPNPKVSDEIVRRGEAKHRNSKWPDRDTEVAFEIKEEHHVTVNQYQYLGHQRRL